MIQYKIKSVRFYQAVVVCGVNETFILNPEYNTMRRDSQKSLKLSTNEQGLIIESDSDLTLVSWNNLAAIYYDKSSSLNDSSKEESKPASKLSKKNDVDFRNV